MTGQVRVVHTPAIGVYNVMAGDAMVGRVTKREESHGVVYWVAYLKGEGVVQARARHTTRKAAVAALVRALETKG